MKFLHDMLMLRLLYAIHFLEPDIIQLKEDCRKENFLFRKVGVGRQINHLIILKFELFLD